MKKLIYSDPSGIAIVNQDGISQWFQTPFMVRHNNCSDEIHLQIWVEAVARNQLGEVYFIINGLPEPSEHFIVDYGN